jgi:hypothetical protein
MALRLPSAVASWILLLASLRASGEQPPPDPQAGEGYDGRAAPSVTRADLFLPPPRLVLAPLRWTVRAIAWPLRRLVEWDERNNVLATIGAAFSSGDGLIGVRPTLQYSISFTPILGLRIFDSKLLGPTTQSEVTLMTGGLDTFVGQLYLRPRPADRAYDATVRLTWVRRNDQVFTGIGMADDPDTLRRPTATPSSRSTPSAAFA